MSLWLYYWKMIYNIISKMQFQERILQPQTIISIISFIFWLWVVRATLNSKIHALETKVKEFDSLELNTKLAQIMTDIERIKSKLNEK